MPFLVAEILNFQGSAHHVGVGSLSKKLILNTKKPMDILQSIRIPTMGSFFMFAFQN